MVDKETVNIGKDLVEVRRNQVSRQAGQRPEEVTESLTKLKNNTRVLERNICVKWAFKVMKYFHRNLLVWNVPHSQNDQKR